MKQSLGGKCVSELLSIPYLVAAKIYRFPFAGLLRCGETEIAIPMEKVVGIGEINGMARVEVVVDAEDELRHNLEGAKNGKLIQEKEMVGGKIKLSILVGPDDPWDLRLGKDADGKFIFIGDLNA